jgi:glycosyltransferase involved in cell wall biosynthesis
VVPALTEGFGLPVIEAMASGTVVVASNVPAVQDSDPEAVVLIDPFCVESIAQGLLRARNDRPSRQRLIDRGKRAAARFTWPRAAEQTWNVYREVLAD